MDDIIVSGVDAETGLRWYIGSRTFFYINAKREEVPIVGFDVSDPDIIEAIRTRDTGLLDILGRMIDTAHLAFELPGLTHGMDARWEYYLSCGEDALNEYKERMARLIAHPLAPECDKEDARSEIQAIESYYAGRAVKRQLTTRRRVEYSAEHDRLMLALIERDGYRCAGCGTTENITIDHIIPLSKGGSDELENLQLLCQSCNSSKGDRMPQED